MKKRQAAGPQFVQYFGPVVDALKALGGSGQPSEVIDWIANELSVPDEVQNELLSSGQTRFYNQVHWARFYLKKAGYIDSSKRGIWTLTDKGLEVQLSHKDSIRVFREVQNSIKKTKSIGKDVVVAAPEDQAEETSSELDYRSQLMDLLLSLPAGGFERLCQRLLRESGFQQVNVTGRSGDGGIDGNGLLQVNPFVSFQVLFQCKRYTGSVSVSQVRDFRGAMMGRADKGIIMTTGTFTQDARKEAVRDGVPPIELVNGEKLISMMEGLELGLNPVITYEVDDGFFNEFKS